jgi:hypothetical protein
MNMIKLKISVVYEYKMKSKTRFEIPIMTESGKA